MKQIIAVFCVMTMFTVSTFAQFNNVNSNTEAAIQFGQQANVGAVLPSFPVNTTPEAYIAKLHKHAFGLAVRNNILEAEVNASIAPALQALNLTSRVYALVIESDIPYARVSTNGIFVMTSVLARKEFGTGRDLRVGFLLRELTRLRMIAEYGNVVARGNTSAMQAFDLKVTAGAVVLANQANIKTSIINSAIISFANKVPGTQSTYQSDRMLYPGHFVANTQTQVVPISMPAVPGKMGRFLNVVNQMASNTPRPAMENNRNADELHIKGLDRASTADHSKVIAALSR